VKAYTKPHGRPPRYNLLEGGQRGEVFLRGAVGSSGRGACFSQDFFVRFSRFLHKYIYNDMLIYISLSLETRAPAARWLRVPMQELCSCSPGTITAGCRQTRTPSRQARTGKKVPCGRNFGSPLSVKLSEFCLSRSAATRRHPAGVRTRVRTPCLAPSALHLGAIRGRMPRRHVSAQRLIACVPRRNRPPTRLRARILAY
jgi:hypothetical protein